jgi:hypothetical protein
VVNLLLTFLALSGMNYGAMDLTTGKVLATGTSSPMAVNVASGDTCGLYACDEAGTSPYVCFGWFPCPRLVAMPRVSGSLCVEYACPLGSVLETSADLKNWTPVGAPTETGFLGASLPLTGARGFVSVGLTGT